MPHLQERDVMSDTASVWQFDEKIPSDTDLGVSVIRQLLDQLEAKGWPDKDIFGIHMAMEEAVMNAIKHGNKRDLSKQVHVVLKLTQAEFFARVTDEGDGFDPEDVPDPTADENLEKFSGRGLMLMRNFVDAVEFNAKGNSVELRKSKTKTV